MKILHIIPSVSTARGGPSQAVLEMVWELRQQGIDAVIATTNDDGDGLLDVPLSQWIDYPINATDRNKTVPLKFFPRFSPAVTSIREFALSLSLTTWLWRHIAEYDLLHIHAIFSYPSTMAMAIARVRKIPYIIRPLGQLCQWSLQQSAQKKQTYLRLIERQNLQKACALHFTSQQEQQEAAALALATPSFILPHGLALPAPMPDAKAQLREWLQLPADQPIILFLARLHPKKGLDTLITALGQLPTQPFQFVIAGSGTPEYEAEIRQRIEAAGLINRTHCVGFVNGDRKQLLLQGADLFALPSHSENFGIAVLEAMAAGLPVLITPGVALAEWVQTQDLGWVVAQSPEAIAGAVTDFLRHPRMANARGQAAATAVRAEFAWPALITQLIHHYQTLQTTPAAPTLTALLSGSH